MHQKYVIGNWKLNPASLSDAQALAQALNDRLSKIEGVQLGCAPSFVHLGAVASVLNGSSLWVGAQDLCAKTQTTGAFTGDVSAAQLVDVGARFVIIGHSERRAYHGEDNTVIADKIRQAMDANLAIVLCVGETKDEYQAEQTLSVLDGQLSVLDGLNVPTKLLVIAYEPVWAIGTGLTPTVTEVEAVHRHIKNTLSAYGLNKVCVLYGGSVNEDNAVSFAKSAWVDGALVGGASLKIDSFAAIIAAFAHS